MEVPNPTTRGRYVIKKDDLKNAEMYKKKSSDL